MSFFSKHSVIQEYKGHFNSPFFIRSVMAWFPEPDYIWAIGEVRGHPSVPGGGHRRCGSYRRGTSVKRTEESDLWDNFILNKQVQCFLTRLTRATTHFWTRLWKPKVVWDQDFCFLKYHSRTAGSRVRVREHLFNQRKASRSQKCFQMHYSSFENK